MKPESNVTLYKDDIIILNYYKVGDIRTYILGIGTPIVVIPALMVIILARNKEL